MAKPKKKNVMPMPRKRGPIKLHKPDTEKFADLLKYSGKVDLNEELKLIVKFPCDLRASIKMKMEDAEPGMWTAFVNNAGWLCHVVHHEDNLLIRLPLNTNVKHLTLSMIHKIILGRLEARFYLR
jgi:hypothetical protein